jgi:steroid delta-isomerase-like uncharacterized protein
MWHHRRMATMTPPAQATNAELIRWAFDVLNHHTVEPLRQFWTDDTVERFPDRTCRGADEIGQYFLDTFAALPDFHIEIVGLAAEGEDVFVRWRITGTHEGRLLGIEPTGKRIALDGVDHFVIRDGRVVSNFVISDQMDYARQLGMIPPDGSPADRAVKAAFNARMKLARRLRR